MGKRLEICGAQDVLPTPNETTKQPFEKITRQVLADEHVDFHLSQNFRFVWEKTKDFLQKISENTGSKREAAIAIAKEDSNFGVGITREVELTLDQRIEQASKANKLSGPKLKMDNKF